MMTQGYIERMHTNEPATLVLDLTPPSAATLPLGPPGRPARDAPFQRRRHRPRELR